MNVQRVTFKTADDVEIVGTYRSPASPTHVAILLHMMPETKESWSVFAEELEKIGYASLAIDERGHGESVMLGALDYHTFDDEQQQAKIQDVEAAFAYLQSQGFTESDVVVIGASIGANLAVQFLANHPSTLLAIALSPGMNYHGVKTDVFITNMHAQQRCVIISSDDDQESFIDAKQLHDLNPAQTTLIEKHGAGHGTRMFKKDPTVMQDLLSMLSQTA